jgi:hypothetical protein
MLHKSERNARMSVEGWVVVLLVASDCSKKVMKRVQAIVRTRQSCEYVYELRRPCRYQLKIHTVVGWRAWLVARLRANDEEKGSVLVRVRMGEPAYRSKKMRCWM